MRYFGIAGTPSRVELREESTPFRPRGSLCTTYVHRHEAGTIYTIA
jgi:hypothetical protein